VTDHRSGDILKALLDDILGITTLLMQYLGFLVLFIYQDKYWENKKLKISNNVPDELKINNTMAS